MKKMFNKMSNTVKTMTCKAQLRHDPAPVPTCPPSLQHSRQGLHRTPPIKIPDLPWSWAPCSWLASTLCSGNTGPDPP